MTKSEAKKVAALAKLWLAKESREAIEALERFYGPEAVAGWVAHEAMQCK